MKFLVVDDDIVSRAKMQDVLSDYGHCVSVEDGRSALIEFKAALDKLRPFRLITLDISMPEMDGKQVLAGIRTEEERRGVPKADRIKVIMVTASSDRDSLLQCVQTGCDDYVIKPFDRDTITRKIKNLGFQATQTEPIPAESASATSRTQKKMAVAREVIRRFDCGEVYLQSPNRIFIEFNKMTRREASFPEIADLLKQDVGLSMQLIGISNSPYYRGVSESKTLEQALQRLGMETTKQYVDLIYNREVYQTGGKKYVAFMDRLWAHSLASAHAAELIAKAAGLTLKDDPFTMGLLHDVGKIVLLAIINELEQSGIFGGEMDPEETRSLIDALHGRMGGGLLERWGFAGDFLQAAVEHDDLTDQGRSTPAVLLIHAANQLAKAGEFGRDAAEAAPDFDDESIRLLGLEPAAVEQVKADLARRMTEMESLLK